MHLRIIIAILLISTHVIMAQPSYEPLPGSIYGFLDDLSIGHIIRLNKEVKPYSREYIRSLLNTAVRHRLELNSTQRSELDFYLREFSQEKTNGLYNLYRFYYTDSLFSFYASPQFKYSVISQYGKPARKRGWGGYIYGTYSSWFGASLTFNDNGERGKTLDILKELDPGRGYFINSVRDGWSEYSDVSGSIDFSWKWGAVSLVKDYQRWGSGEFGQVILSDKVSSFPQIRFSMRPAEWLRFYYIHGWLTSNVPDSVNYYPTGMIRSGKPVLRKEFKQKFIAANFLSIDLWRYLTVSLGNSVIYSDYIKPEYLIPFLIYKFQDHNAGRDDDAGANGQLFFDINLSFPVNYKFYSTVLIDMIDPVELLKGDTHSSWLGYTFGFKRTNLFIANLSFGAEYTKIDPWVYEHYIPTTTYKHLNYTLGHWIGQNADDLRLQAEYKALRGLNFSLYFERLRKGGMKDISFAYTKTENLPFLYGPLRNDYYLGLVARYELLYNFSIQFSYRYSDISDQDTIRTPSYMSGYHHSLSLQFSCGL